MVAARRQELEEIEGEILPQREEIGTFEERLTETEADLVQRSTELAEVGERLEAARSQEAEVQARLAELTEESARLTQEALAAEESLQVTREAEASLEIELAAAREAFAQIEREQEELAEQVRTLEERREILAADTEAARNQREALMASVQELAETVAARGEDVRTLEARMGELMAADTAIDRAVAAGLRPGQYIMGPIAAHFAADGTFEMASADGGQSVTGRYAVEDGILTLEDVEGDIRWTEFPVSCAIEPEAIGFSLHAQEEEGGCDIFSGQLFERAS
jgi:hypothetical protein